MAQEKRPMKILLAAPRGFCAGVDRAIQIVEQAIAKFGTPVYVRHEIVHNRHVVERLERIGAIFVEELGEAPVDRPVVFSAHGVPKSVPAEAERREMIYIDATCPLVSKVHVEAQRHYAAGMEIVLIGHAGHPEVVGTLGQLPEGVITLIETVDDAGSFEPKDPARIAFVTQTTLSVDDTAEIVSTLQKRFPQIEAPHKEDICYATTNRQAAVKAMAEPCDVVLVIGSETSSNSKRLVEVAIRAGAKQAALVEDASVVDWSMLAKAKTIGITAGASAPEQLVEDLIAAIGDKYETSVEELRVTDENVVFKLPRLVA